MKIIPRLRNLSDPELEQLQEEVLEEIQRRLESPGETMLSMEQWVRLRNIVAGSASAPAADPVPRRRAA